MCGGRRLTFRRQLSSATWVLEIELRPLDLVASDFTHRTNSRSLFPVCFFLIFIFCEHFCCYFALALFLSVGQEF